MHTFENITSSLSLRPEAKMGCFAPKNLKNDLTTKFPPP